MTDDASLGASTGFGGSGRAILSLGSPKWGTYSPEGMEDSLWGRGKKEQSFLFGLMVYFKSERESLAIVGRLSADELWPSGLSWWAGGHPGGGRRALCGRNYLSTL